MAQASGDSTTAPVDRSSGDRSDGAVRPSRRSITQRSPDSPLVSFVLATHQRPEIVGQTLQRIQHCGLPEGSFEILVVENPGRTNAPIAADVAGLRRIRAGCNYGSCAKALAMPHAAGRYLMLLDDDAYPLGDSMTRMVEHFEADPHLAAAGFDVQLTDGSRECAALPNVFVGCGVGLRRSAVEQVGGLDLTYFMQAEEYDLAFRLLQAGHTVRCFPDLQVLHLKSPAGRHDGRRSFYDTRNNLTLAAQYLPAPWHREFLRDWSWRYGWLARECGARRPYYQGRLCGVIRGFYRRRRSATLNPHALEQLFGIEQLRRAMTALYERGHRKVLLAELGKNIYPHFDAARRAGLEVLAVLDDRFAALTRRYRGVAVRPCAEGTACRADAVVVSNSAPVHARKAQQRLRLMTDWPVYRPHGRWDFEAVETAEETCDLPG